MEIQVETSLLGFKDGMRLVDTGISGGGGGGTALPALGNIIGDWNSVDLAVVGDGTAVTSWTESINGRTLSTGGSSSPTYKNNAVGSKPSVAFTGAAVVQWLTGVTTEVVAAANAKNFTIMTVVTNCAAPTNGNFGFAVNTTDGAGVNWRHNGTSAGVPGLSNTVPYTSTGFTIGGVMHTSNYGGHGAQYQAMLNGSLIGQGSVNLTASSSVQVGFGAGRTGTGPFKGEILRVLVWNRKLTLCEYLQAERSLRDYYGQAYPWTAPGYYMLNIGDSITFALGTTARANAWPYKLATALSLPFGAWSNLGYVGSNASICGDIITAENLAGIAATIGVPVKATYAEFYNQRALITNPISTSVAVTTTQTTLTLLKACGKVLFWDATDYKNRATVKSDWVGYWNTPANQTGYMDVYVKVSDDANIGVDGACPDALPYGTYFSNAVNNFTCNATTNGTNAVTVNSVSTGGVNMVAGASFTGSGIPAGTLIFSGPVGGGAGAYVLTNAATTSTTGTFTGGSGDGIHPGDGAQDTFVTLFQAPFAAM
jgi:hypothetical protein